MKSTVGFFVKETLVSAAWVALINAMGLVIRTLPIFVALPPFVTATPIAMSWLFLLVVLFGWLNTGAFYSPSIATSFSVAGILPYSSLPLALLAELLGALLGAHALSLFVKLYLGLGDLSVINVPALNTQVASSWIDGAVVEGVLMFLLCMAIYSTMSFGRFLAPIVVGFVAVTLCVLGGQWTGPIMNPISAFGANYLADRLDLTHFQVYWLGSILGGILAGLVYRLFLRPKPSVKEQKKQKKQKNQ